MPPLMLTTRFCCFLAFDHYIFIPEEYNAPALFPHDSLEAAKTDHLAETLITTFHNVTLTDVLPSDAANKIPSDAANKIYPTILQIALPAIMGDKVLLAYQFFLFDFTSSDQGQSFCSGMVPNGFHNPKILTRTMHPKLLTTPKAPKKKKKKQIDEWNKSPETLECNKKVPHQVLENAQDQEKENKMKQQKKISESSYTEIRSDSNFVLASNKPLPSKIVWGTQLLGNL
uniref:Uncharacterized protein n=1 Tax=Romanomermis culicivorax TaxID=13658 RepID=A0A915IBC4_ROMCU